MKKLILLSLFFYITNLYSQQQISLKLDYTNAIVGSEINSPSLNYIISYSDVYNYWDNTYLGFFFEQFDKIDYIQFGTKIDHVFRFNDLFYTSNKLIYNTDLLIGVEAGIVFRNVKYADNAINYGCNLEIQHKIINNLKFSIQFNYEIANDVSQFSRKSGYAGLVYEIN